MSDQDEEESLAAKFAKYEKNFTYCILCQDNGEDLVEKPISHENLLEKVRERAKYGDTKYANIRLRLGKTTATELQNKGVSWHSNCYKEAVHAGMINRAKKRYEKQLSVQGVKKNLPKPVFRMMSN